jgi:hypothetical protein
MDDRRAEGGGTATAALAVVASLGLGLTGCVSAHLRPSWAIYPLPRQHDHDGLAVVSQPDGYGLHIWLETDTSQTGLCRPRWIVDPARLFNGNGTAPFSSGLATQAEFFAAVARKDVQRALKRELKALCQRRAPRAQWQWINPPRKPAEVKVQTFPLVEEQDLLSDPAKVRQEEEALTNGAPPAS